MKSAIIVGASSMLGRELARQLINDGIEVITAGRRPDSDIRVDLGGEQVPVFSRTYTADVLFHCASAFGGDNPDGLRENFRVKVGGCQQTLEIARETSANKIVYAGSRKDGVFMRLGYQPEISLQKGLGMIRDAGTSERFGPMDVQ